MLSRLTPPVCVLLALAALAGCGEDKLARMQRLSQVGPRPDPDATTPAVVQPPAESAVVKPQPAPQPAAQQSALSQAAAPAAASPAPAVVAPVAQPAAAAPKLVANDPPAAPLSSAQRRERTIANLTKIAAALQGYTEGPQVMPAGAMFSESGKPTVSWRVRLLPRLGYQKLYDRFNLDEPWDSPQNKVLLREIPPEYQSPERFDDKTNYLLLVGPRCITTTLQAQSLEKVADGVENTLVLVEADDGRAVPWTAPEDLAVDLAAPRSGLGSLRSDGFFAVLGNFRLCRIPGSTTPEQLAGLITVAGGEKQELAALTAEATIPEHGPLVAAAAALPGGNATASQAAATPVANPTATAGSGHATNPPPGGPTASAGPPVLSGAAGAASALDVQAIVAYLQPPQITAGKTLIPPADELKAARDLLREVYAADYKTARTPEQRKQLATKMFTDAGTLENPAELWELLSIVRTIAAQAGDLPTAGKVVDLQRDRFQVDALMLRSQMLDEVAKGKAALLPSLAAPAEAALREAADAHHYAAATLAYETWAAAVRSQQNKTLSAKLEPTKLQLEGAARAYQEVVPALSVFQQNPVDLKACELLGKYLCLVKNRWDLGLPLLARSSDVRLKVVALIDLDGDKDARALAQLGDQYLDLAESYKQPQKTNLQLRAAHCFGAALPLLSGGLEKIRVQKKLDEAVQFYGRETIDRMVKGASFGNASPAEPPGAAE